MLTVRKQNVLPARWPSEQVWYVCLGSLLYRWPDSNQIIRNVYGGYSAEEPETKTVADGGLTELSASSTDDRRNGRSSDCEFDDHRVRRSSARPAVSCQEQSLPGAMVGSNCHTSAAKIGRRWRPTHDSYSEIASGNKFRVCVSEFEETMCVVYFVASSAALPRSICVVENT